jgi:hypothetical protein
MLREDSLIELGVTYPDTVVRSADPKFEKYVIPLPQKCSQAARPVRAIYVITAGGPGKSEIVDIYGAKKIEVLTRQTFRGQAISRERAALYARRMIEVSENVRTAELRVARTYAGLEECCDLIQQDLLK